MYVRVRAFTVQLIPGHVLTHDITLTVSLCSLPFFLIPNYHISEEFKTKHKTKDHGNLTMICVHYVRAIIFR
jgi:hypothetical protein